jgi:hypothetical protein
MNTNDQQPAQSKPQAALEPQDYQVPKLEQHQIWLQTTGLSVPIGDLGFPEGEGWQ